MEKDGKDKKPKYNMWQNNAFMVGLSWRFCKSVVLLLVAAAVSSAGLSIAEVLVSPVLLSKIESYVPFSELIAYIAMFVGILAGLSAIKAYIGENTLLWEDSSQVWDNRSLGGEDSQHVLSKHT